MKKVEFYDCSLCGKRFFTESECLDHEKQHPRIKKIVQEYFLKNNSFADFIVVKLEDGRYIRYKFDESVKEKVYEDD